MIASYFKGATCVKDRAGFGKIRRLVSELVILIAAECGPGDQVARAHTSNLHNLLTL